MRRLGPRLVEFRRGHAPGLARGHAVDRAEKSRRIENRPVRRGRAAATGAARREILDRAARRRNQGEAGRLAHEADHPPVGRPERVPARLRAGKERRVARRERPDAHLTLPPVRGHEHEPCPVRGENRGPAERIEVPALGRNELRREALGGRRLRAASAQRERARRGRERGRNRPGKEEGERLLAPSLAICGRAGDGG